MDSQEEQDKHYGSLREMAERQEISYNTLKTYQYVSGQYELYNRLYTLSYKHYMIAAPLDDRLEWLKKQRVGREAQNKGAEMCLMAMRKLGEMLSKNPDIQQGGSKYRSSTLKKYGVDDRHNSSLWQKLAEIPEEDIYREKAKEKQLSGLKQYRDTVLQNSAERDIDTREELARIANVSHDTIMKVGARREKTTYPSKH